jgi:hypothetical protein
MRRDKIWGAATVIAQLIDYRGSYDDNLAGAGAELAAA